MIKLGTILKLKPEHFALYRPINCFVQARGVNINEITLQDFEGITYIKKESYIENWYVIVGQLQTKDIKVFIHEDKLLAIWEHLNKRQDLFEVLGVENEITSF